MESFPGKLVPVDLDAPLPDSTGLLVESLPDYVLNDYAWAQAWLGQYRDSPKSFRAVRKEIERFLAWWHDRAQQSIRVLDVPQVDAYKAFLSNPQPTSKWVADRKHPRHSPEWRPFYGKNGAGGLSPESAAYSFTILKAFCTWLEAQELIPKNAFRFTKKPKTRKKKLITRFLSDKLLLPIQQTIENDPNPRRQARDRFLFALYYTTGLRAFEAGEARMNQVIPDDQGRQWLHVIGKGGVEDRVPLSATVLDALVAYRTTYGLPERIDPDEDTALIMPIRGPLRMASASTVLRAVKDIMARTIDEVDPSQQLLMLQLRRATTHWLRHSRFSHLAQSGVPLLKIKSLARHADITTTNLYLHTEDEDVFDMVSSQDLPSRPHTR